jgi:hypothetical protein
MLLKNKIRYEYETNNLRNLLQQLQKLDKELMQSILDIDYNVSNYLNFFCQINQYFSM